MNSTTRNSDGDVRPDGPRSPHRVMQALEELAASKDGLSLTRLSERLQTPKTSLLNLLRSLEAGSYVTQVNGYYQLGANALRLGALISARVTPESSISAKLHPLLSEMMEQGGETTLLGVMGDDRKHGVYVDIVEGRSAIRFSSLVGTRRPLFCSAFGKILMAFQPPEQISAYLQQTDLVLPNGGRRLHPEEVMGSLAAIRATGVSVSHEEIVEGAGGVAAPVYDRNGNVVAVFTIAAPIARLKSQHERLIALVHVFGERASRTIGFTGAYPGAR
jgi:IclR family acetate operon transcriptional repressor